MECTDTHLRHARVLVSFDKIFMTISILGSLKKEDLTGKSYCCVFFLNLNLNSLLVIRQIDNPSPGAVTGGN